jgi:hypothetical protein
MSDNSESDRLHMPFVVAYHNLFLAEPDSAVRHECKEAF